MLASSLLSRDMSLPPHPLLPTFPLQSGGPSPSVSVITLPCTLLGMSGGHPCPSKILFPHLAQPFSYTSFSIHCSGNGRSWAPRTTSTFFSHQAISVFTFFNSSFQGAGSAFREVFSIEWKAWIWGSFCILKVDHHARWQSKIDQAGCLVQAPRTYL